MSAEVKKEIGLEMAHVLFLDMISSPKSSSKYPRFPNEVDETTDNGLLTGCFTEGNQVNEAQTNRTGC